MNDNIVREIFIVKNGYAMRVPGTRFTTLTLPENEKSDCLARTSDPLNALDQQNRHAAAVEKSKVQSIKFERLPKGLVITPGCLLESETFGDTLRVVRYSDAEVMAEVESA